MQKFTNVEKNIALRFAEAVDVILKQNEELTKSAFAESIGTYCHVISDIQNLKRKPTTKQVHELCSKYGVNPKYIFSRSKILLLADIPPSITIGGSKIEESQLCISINEVLNDMGIGDDKISQELAQEFSKLLFCKFKEEYH